MNSLESYLNEKDIIKVYRKMHYKQKTIQSIQYYKNGVDNILENNCKNQELDNENEDEIDPILEQLAEKNQQNRQFKHLLQDKQNSRNP